MIRRLGGSIIVTAMVTPAALVAITVPPRAGAEHDLADVPSTSPFHRSISRAAEARVVNGFPDGRFRPRATVTRQSRAAFIYRFRESPIRAC